MNEIFFTKNYLVLELLEGEHATIFRRCIGTSDIASLGSVLRELPTYLSYKVYFPDKTTATLEYINENEATLEFDVPKKEEKMMFVSFSVLDNKRSDEQDFILTIKESK